MTKTTVVKDEGIGPEMMDATLDAILAKGDNIDFEEIEFGEKAYLVSKSSFMKQRGNMATPNLIFVFLSFLCSIGFLIMALLYKDVLLDQLLKALSLIFCLNTVRLASGKK